MHDNRWAFPLGLLLSIFLFTAFASAERAVLPPTEKVVIAQFGKEKFLLYLPLYVAMEEGLFSRRGLDVELKFAGNDDQIFATVISGDAQFGVGDPVFAAISRERGFPGRVVAIMVTKLGLSGFTNKIDVPKIQSLADLQELRLGSLPAPSTTYTLLSAMIRNNGLEPQGARIVEVAIGGQLAALEADAIDIAVDFEPAVTIAESKGYRVNFAFDKFTEPQAITGLTVTEAMIKSRPETVQKVVTAIQEALDILHRSPEISLRVGRKLFPTLDEAVVKAAVTRMLSLDVYPKSAVVDDVLWQRSLATRLKSKELKKPQQTSETVDNRFAEEAHRDLSRP